MAVAPYRFGQALGFLTPLPALTSTSSVNAAANWYALSFVADSGRTLSAVRAFVSTVGGTLAGTDITCSLYDSTGTSGVPGSSVEAGKLPTATITAAGWYNFTGFTTALTANQQYWLVFKNVNAVPATNFATFRFMRNNAAGNYIVGSSANRQNWAVATSTNSGGAWSVNLASSALRVSYSDGSFDGIPLSNSAAAAVGDGVYSTRESGVKFTTPPGGILQVLGLALYVGAPTGTPTGSPRFGLWTGSTPANLAYTNSLLTTTIGSGPQWVYSYFSSVQTLQPNTIVRVTLGETTQSDASTNRNNMQEITCDTDSNSLALLPWEGTCVKTYFDGSNWTDTSGSIFGHALLLDTAGEFGSGGGGGFISNINVIT